MANNPYVNKVIYGDQTVMDISDSTASESDVAAGEIFYKANGARSVGTASSNYYSPTDATSTDIDDADYIPFYDNSASAKKNSLWSTIKAKLNEIFFRRSEANVLGAKNLFKRFPVDTYTIDDVVFTQNANGSITVNGTVGSSVVTWRQNIVLKAGSYIVSGGVSSTDFVGIYDYNTTQYIATSVEGSDEFTLAQDTEVGLTIRINKNQTVNNIVFYPMLRFASDPDGVYQPFAMTNKELTDKIGTLGSAATKNVPASGDAGQTEVVLGSDTRLTDARTPTAHNHTTSQITDFPTLATVATSGLYSDLTGTPTLATVATSGSYGDLLDEPTNQSAAQYDQTVSLCTRHEKYKWNFAYDTQIKWSQDSALAGATAAYIPYDDSTGNDILVAVLADDGTTKPIIIKSAEVVPSSGGIGAYVALTFSALAHNTTFKVGII